MLLLHSEVSILLIIGCILFYRSPYCKRKDVPTAEVSELYLVDTLVDTEDIPDETDITDTTHKTDKLATATPCQIQNL